MRYIIKPGLTGSTVEKQYLNDVFCDVLFEESQHLLLFGQRIDNLRQISKQNMGRSQSRYLINENGVPQNICKVNGITEEMRVVVCKEGNV